MDNPALFPRIGIRLPGLTLGPKRLTAPALTVRDLPKIDIVLLDQMTGVITAFWIDLSAKGRVQ